MEMLIRGTAKMKSGKISKTAFISPEGNELRDDAAGDCAVAEEKNQETNNNHTCLKYLDYIPYIQCSHHDSWMRYITFIIL